MSEQIKNKLDKTTLSKIGKGCLLAGGGAVLVYLLQAVMNIDFGSSTPVIVALASVLLNALKEYRKGN